MDENAIPKYIYSAQLREEQRNSIIVTHKDDPARNGWIDSVKLILFIAFVIVAASWLEGF